MNHISPRVRLWAEEEPLKNALTGVKMMNGSWYNSLINGSNDLEVGLGLEIRK
jgi:hypothetical protein